MNGQTLSTVQVVCDQGPQMSLICLQTCTYVRERYRGEGSNHISFVLLCLFVYFCVKIHHTGWYVDQRCRGGELTPYFVCLSFFVGQRTKIDTSLSQLVRRLLCWKPPKGSFTEGFFYSERTESRDFTGS